MSIRLMTRVWDETRFKGTELLVLLCLADHANDEGVCWPSYAKLAKRSRCSRRQAMRCVERLEKEGWLRVSKRRIGERMNASNSYQLIIGGGGDILEGGGDICDIGGDTHDTRVVTPMTPKPSGNHKIEPSVEPVLGSHRANEVSFQDLPGIEEVEEVVCGSTGLSFSHASMCAEKWLRAVKGKKLTNWRAHLEAFADKYECDYRR